MKGIFLYLDEYAKHDKELHKSFPYIVFNFCKDHNFGEFVYEFGGNSLYIPKITSFKDQIAKYLEMYKPTDLEASLSIGCSTQYIRKLKNDYAIINRRITDGF